MTVQRKKSYRFTVDFTPATRGDLDRLLKLSRTCTSKSAVISRIAMQYLAMLERQLEAEKRGERLVVCRRAEEGSLEPLLELDLRL